MRRCGNDPCIRQALRGSRTPALLQIRQRRCAGRPQPRQPAGADPQRDRRGRDELEPLQRRRRPGSCAPADPFSEPGDRPARQGLPRLRQTAAIAYNDTRKLVGQLVYLDRNTLAIEKARDAYRQQFDIGQRSLLDLLNAENEVYTARRAYANAEHDLGFAYARTHAAMNPLGATLGISRADNVATDAAGWSQGDDAPTRCPVIVAEVPSVEHSELDARAQKLVASAPAPVRPAGATPLPAPGPVAPRKP